MHLKSGIVAMIVAAAAGAAAGRGSAPHGATVAAAPVANMPGGLDVSAAGKLRGESTTTLGDGSTFEAPVARGRVRNPAPSGGNEAFVYVAGAVARPGVYALRGTARADDALRAAGGATASADLVAVNLAARVEDGEEIAVPLRGAEATGTDGTRPRTKKHSRRHAGKRGHRQKRHRESDDSSVTADTPATDAPAEMVDVNGADEATLETLPGIGPSLARRIVAFRDLNGPFASTDELLDVGGMTSGKVDAISEYLTFH